MSDLAAIVSSLIEPPYAPWSLGSVRPPFPALLTPSLTPPSSRLRHHSAATVLTHASHANRSQTSPLPRPMPACGQSLTSPTPAASPSSASPCLPCSSRAQRNPGILDMPEHHCSRRRRARRRIQRRLHGHTPSKTLCDTRSCASTMTCGWDCPGHGIPVVLQRSLRCLIRSRACSVLSIRPLPCVPGSSLKDGDASDGESSKCGR